MKKIAIISVNETGSQVASQIQSKLNAQLISRADLGSRWNDFDAFIFIGAMGICVRTIAPYINDKHTDPAVICIDSLGKQVISVLSGHVGGANELTNLIANILTATPVITTQSDLSGWWPLDTIGERFNWQTLHATNPAIFAFVNQKPTALLLDIHDEGTNYLERTLPPHVTIVNDISDVSSDKFELAIIVSYKHYESIKGVIMLQYVPKVLTVGIGLAHHAQPVEDILNDINQLMVTSELEASAIKKYATIDLKADEPVVKYLQAKDTEVVFYTADELSKVDVPTPSETVAAHVGTPSVCEAAAILGSNNGKLIIQKVKGQNWTAAFAIDYALLRAPKHGHIEIVGAGPGDPDLVSVRGRKMLEKADLILYAGSLVPKELTECHKPGATVLSSASMALEEQVELMKRFYDEGKFIVRLHTGDPCIFGAIQEQMNYFDHWGMSYHITPGISSFLAAAAELRSQFTIPERVQTIILTRGEGRTPMPEKEKLHLLAKSQSTMCIFLSAAIVDEVQKELLMEYPEDTPVAACYHLTWKDQRIYRGVLKDLAKIVKDNNLTLTTMLVVGDAIDNRQGLSELYNKQFTHLFRKGEE
ncbi:MAG: precorrin-4 C(11)-methyltransferase [Bacteroidaceae bacterium]|jgi:precorrin-4 C11-methyltransferase|nr:precorrin-4 C(11)-methyltransferase [Bacteroidaceae bacterium]